MWGKLDEAMEELGAKFLKLSKLSLYGIKKQFVWVAKTDWHTMVRIDEITREDTPWITAGSFSDDAKERLRSFVEKRSKKQV